MYMYMYMYIYFVHSDSRVEGRVTGVEEGDRVEKGRDGVREGERCTCNLLESVEDNTSLLMVVYYW